MTPTRTNAAFQDLLRYDAARHGSLDPASSQGPPPALDADSSIPPPPPVSILRSLPSPGGGEEGRVKRTAKAIDEAERTRKEQKAEEQAMRKQAKAEKRRIKKALREQKKNPIVGDRLPRFTDVAESVPAPPPSGGEGGAEQAWPAPPPAGIPPTPLVLKGENAVLVRNEMIRLQDKYLKDKRRKWRIWAGALSLCIIGFSSYFLARYVVAYLQLSPASVLLSEARQGISASLDSLMQTLCLVFISSSAASLACMLVVVVFLRVVSMPQHCSRSFPSQADVTFTSSFRHAVELAAPPWHGAVL